MMVKAKGRREAHLHEMRIRATCVKQLVGKAGYKGSLLMHVVCQECRCVPMSHMCWSYVEENAKRRHSTRRALVFTVGIAKPGSATGTKAAFWSSKREIGKSTRSIFSPVRSGSVLGRTPCRRELSRITCIAPTGSGASQEIGRIVGGCHSQNE